MSQVLYRKYRSQDFDQLYGQNHIIQVLKQAIKEDKIAHAYLFNGPRGTGKTSTARIIAKALNCKNLKDSNPCNECSSCIAISEGRFLDLVEIDAASNRGIDEIRDLKEKVNFLAAEGGKKVYIIDEVHMLTNEAFNALLKTLEEPPSHVVFILATTEVHKLPQTVISRTQRFDFRLAEHADVKGKLEYILKHESISFDSGALEVIIEAANGSYRDAETILEKVISSFGYQVDGEINRTDVEQVLGFANHQLVEKLIEYLVGADYQSALSILSEASSQGVDLSNYTKQILELLRKKLVVAVEKRDTNNILLYSKIIRSFSTAYQEIGRSPIPLLALELAIVEVMQSMQNTGAVASTLSRPITNNSQVNGQISKVSTNEERKEVNKQSNVEKKEKVDLSSKQVEDVVTKTSKTISKVVDNISPDVNYNGDLDNVINNWAVLIAKAKDVNPHLSAILIKVRPYELGSDNIVRVKVPFEFHKKRLEKENVRQVIASITSQLFGAPLRMEIIVEKEEAGTSLDSTNDNSSNSSLVEEVFNELI